MAEKLGEKKKVRCSVVPFHWLNLYHKAGLDAGFWIEVAETAQARGVRKENRSSVRSICEEVYMKRQRGTSTAGYLVVLLFIAVPTVIGILVGSYLVSARYKWSTQIEECERMTGTECRLYIRPVTQWERLSQSQQEALEMILADVLPPNGDYVEVEEVVE